VQPIDRHLLTACPCGSEAGLEACCGPRLAGTRPAESAEALMRSRYTAFTLADAEYLQRTHEPPLSDDERQELGKWARSVHWLGLEILLAEPPIGDGTSATVEFVARYLQNGSEVALREKSQFARRDGVWFYLDGRPELTRRRVDRNGPCVCGSGRKFKQCHA
jgi:SEC-C motif domain protein